MSDPASTYTRLRAETAALLGVDPDDLSKTEGLRLDITSLLLLEIDSLQGSILANEKVDLARVSTALGMLQKLLPESALVAPVAESDVRDHGAAFNRIAEQIDRQIEQNKRKEAASGRCERCGAPLADATDNANPGGGDEVSPASPPLAVAGSGPGNVDLAAVSPAAADGGDASDSSPRPPLSRAPAGDPPVLVEPTPAPPPQRVESDVERMNRVNSTPALPPAREPEPWRKFVDADGNIISPWFIPHG
jgi:hypothetical protein